MIDLRSDTVTKPSKEMLQKVLEAELGDDEYKEDPTVNSLEEYCSELMGFESGLFVTSGLMGNQISLLIHSNPGEEVITTKDSHIKNYEQGGYFLKPKLLLAACLLSTLLLFLRGCPGHKLH